MKRLILTTLACFGLATSSPADQGKPFCDGMKLFECTHLAMNYQVGLSPFPVDPERAETLLTEAERGARKGCSGENYILCYTFKDIKFSRAQDGTDFAQAIDDYKSMTEPGCDAGDAAACYWRSILFTDSSVRRAMIEATRDSGGDLVTAARDMANDKKQYDLLAKSYALQTAAALRPLCQAGDDMACGDLGVLIKDFELPPASPYEHVNFLVRGCLSGNADACYSAEFAIGGLGLVKPKQDVEIPIRDAATQKFEQHCEQGNAEACYVRGELEPLLGGDVTYYEKACDLDHARSCGRLGTKAYSRYRKSKAAEDLLPAAEFFIKACELGDTRSCHYVEHFSKG